MKLSIWGSSTTTQPEEAIDIAEAILSEDVQSLIVWNDEVNTFDHVIEALIDICEHSAEQAEQCALFIHHKGKYAVKSGSFDALRPRCEALINRGIGATIGG